MAPRISASQSQANHADSLEFWRPWITITTGVSAQAELDNELERPLPALCTWCAQCIRVCAMVWQVASGFCRMHMRHPQSSKAASPLQLWGEGPPSLSEQGVVGNRLEGPSWKISHHSAFL